jgi:hypothetical protein
MVGLLRDWLAGAYFTGDNHGQSKKSAFDAQEKLETRGAGYYKQVAPCKTTGWGAMVESEEKRRMMGFAS